MHRNSRAGRSQRGNILFLILLAVVLFAALSYAVTAAMRGGGKDGGSESGEADAARLLNYFSQIDTAVQRMMLTGGIEDYELNFYYDFTNNFIQGNSDNQNCTTSGCRVFDPAGGAVKGIRFQDFQHTPSASYDEAMILYASVSGSGTSKPDIVLAVRGVRGEICKSINKKIGYDGVIPAGTIPTDSSSWMYQFPIPTGSIPDITASTPANITSAIGSRGVFCSCHSATVTNDCQSGGFPVAYYVLVRR